MIFIRVCIKSCELMWNIFELPTIIIWQLDVFRYRIPNVLVHDPGYYLPKSDVDFHTVLNKTMSIRQNMAMVSPSGDQLRFSFRTTFLDPKDHFLLWENTHHALHQKIGTHKVGTSWTYMGNLEFYLVTPVFSFRIQIFLRNNHLVAQKYKFEGYPSWEILQLFRKGNSQDEF